MNPVLGVLGALLFWRAGIDPWQWVLLPIAAVVLARRTPPVSLQPLDALEWTALALLAWLGLGAISSLRPSITAAQCAGLATFTALVMLLRRQDLGTGLPRLQTLFHGLASAGTVLFLAAGAWMGRVHLSQGTETVGGFALPHHPIRLFYPNQNLFVGGVLVPAALFAVAALAAGGKRGWLALLALYGAGIAYAGSRGAYLCLAAGLGLLTLRLARRQGARGLRWPLAAVALLAALTLALPISRLAQRAQLQSDQKLADPNYFRRAEFWKGSLRLWAERPLQGYGLGSFADAALRLDLPTPLTERNPVARYRLRLEHAHNEYLELLVEAGLPGLLGLLLLLFFFWRARWSAQSGVPPGDVGLEAAILSCLVLALTDLNFHAPSLLYWSGLWAVQLLPSKPPAAPLLRPWSSAILLPCLALALALPASLAIFQAGPLARPNRPGLEWSIAAQRHLQAGRSRDLVERQALLAEADQRMLKAEALSPYRASMRLFHFQVLHELGREAEAEAQLERCLELEPNYARAWELRTRLALQKGRPAEVKAALRRLREIRQLTFKDEEPDGYSLLLLEADWAWVEGQWQGL